MKIAISSTGKNLESDVDARFGRCAYFLIVEVKNKKIKDFKTIENTATPQMGGAGITAAEIVANQKPDTVITTNLGPRAFQVFNQFKIKVYKGQGKIKNVMQDFIDGKLTKMSEASGPQHKGLK